MKVKQKVIGKYPLLSRNKNQPVHLNVNQYVACYDKSTLNIVWRKTYPSEVKVSGIEYEYHSGHFLGEKIVVIYSGFNKKAKRYQFKKRVLDQEGVEEKLAVFCRIPAKKDDDITFEIKQVLEGQNILIQAFTNWEEKSKYIRAFFFWLDKDMNMLDEYKFDTRVYPEDAYIVDVAVNQKKDVFVLIDKNKDKRLKKNYKGEFILWKCSAGNETMSRDYNLGEQFINDANLSFNEINQELVVQGFLGFEKRDQINGIYAHVFTPELNEKQMKVLPVTQQLVKDWVGERNWAERMSRGNKLNLKYMESLNTSAGGTYVIYEDTRITYYNDGSGNWWAGDVFILFYNKSHEVEFYTVLGKENAVSIPSSRHTVSYGRKLVGDDLYVYLAARAQSLEKSYPEIASLKDRAASGYAVLECQVEPDGNVDVNDLYIYKASIKFFYPDTRDFQYNESTDHLFFTIGNGYSRRKWPISIQKD